MKSTKILSTIISAVLLVCGIVGTVYFRSGAIGEQASADAKMYMSLFLILSVIGLVKLIAGFVPAQRRSADTRTLVYSAMFAALCYIGFAYLKIDIPVAGSSTAFHLGNVFVVLAALFLGGYWGGLAGAVGLSIADLTTQYVTSAPKTFILKLCIGLICGAVAHHVFHLNRDIDRKLPLTAAAAISCASGMAFNVVADPVVGYFYKQYLLGVPQDAAKTLAKIGAATTLVNAVLAVIVATVLYLALRSPMKRTGMLEK